MPACTVQWKAYTPAVAKVRDAVAFAPMLPRSPPTTAAGGLSKTTLWNIPEVLTQVTAVFLTTVADVGTKVEAPRQKVPVLQLVGGVPPSPPPPVPTTASALPPQEAAAAAIAATPNALTKMFIDHSLARGIGPHPFPKVSWPLSRDLIDGTIKCYIGHSGEPDKHMLQSDPGAATAPQ